MFPSNPYESSNVSHLQFRREFVYLNALYYLIVQCKDAEKLSDYGLSSKKISEIFDSINISIASDEFEMQQIKKLAATRNVIEHNNGKVNSEYLTLTGYDLNIGDPVLANSKEVGEALAITEHIVQNVNIRAVKIWPQLLENK